MTDSTFSYSDFTSVKSGKKRKNKTFKLSISPSHSLARLRDQIRQEEWFMQCSRRCHAQKNLLFTLNGVLKKIFASRDIRKLVEFVFY